MTIGSVHAKCRKGGQKYTQADLPLENLQSDDYHLAFEYWVKESGFLHPCGKIIGMKKIPYLSLGDDKALRSCLEQIRISTIICSTPTRSGTIGPTEPMLLRVGLLTEEGRSIKGSTEKSISDPLAVRSNYPKIRNELLHTHRFREISKLHPQWPSDVSLFIEFGILEIAPKHDYTLPDLKGSTFQKVEVE